MFDFDGILGYHFPANETGFTDWDCYETPFGFLQTANNQTVHTFNEPAISESPLENSCVIIDDDETDKNKTHRGTGSHDRTPKTGPIHLDMQKLNAGPDEKPGSVIDDRRLRRMISNRESARRSRMRKQKHLDNLRDEMNRIRTGNKELANRLQFVLHHTRVMRRENDRFRSESGKLKERLWAMRQILVIRQLQQQQLNNSCFGWPSLVT